jgi:hypothetical protein
MVITISPAQALLILIEDALEKEKANTLSKSPISTISPIGVDFFAQDRAFTPVNFDKKEDVNSSEKASGYDSETLIRLFTLGARSPEEKNVIMELLRHPLLSEYIVSTEPHVINEDAVRRYFETKLAETSLRYGLKKLNAFDLEKHYIILKELIGQFEPRFKHRDNLKKFVFQKVGEDFRELYRYIAKKTFSSDEMQQAAFGGDDWDKMRFLWFIWSYSFVAAGYDKKLPLRIYTEGFFNEESRSRQDRYPDPQAKMYSNNLGLFKSTMPTPAYSKMRTKATTVGLVLSDYRTYTQGEWSEYSFSHLVHPYGNSISGTILVQLRVFAAIKNDKELLLRDPFVSLQENDGTPLKEKLADYFRVFSALLLYGCGGHSWFEFLVPITLDKVREEFRDLPEFERLDMEYILFHNNEEAIKESIEETIQYSNHMLQRAKMHEQVQELPTLAACADNNGEYIRSVIQVMQDGMLEYDRWKHYKPIYTRGLEAAEMDKVYDLFDAIEESQELVEASEYQESVWLLLNEFFASETIDERGKQSVYHYIQFKICGALSDDDDYSFLRGPGV